MSKDVTGSESLYRVRSIKNKIAMVLSCGATAFGLLWLVWILLTTIIKGIDALNLQLFTGMTPPPGTEGGLANAFYGSVLMSGIGLLIGTPIGLMAGIWLAEFARYTKLGNAVRFIKTSCCRHLPSCSACSFIPLWYCHSTQSQAIRWAFRRLPVRWLWHCWSSRWWCVPLTK